MSQTRPICKMNLGYGERGSSKEYISCKFCIYFCCWFLLWGKPPPMSVISVSNYKLGLHSTHSDQSFPVRMKFKKGFKTMCWWLRKVKVNVGVSINSSFFFTRVIWPCFRLPNVQIIFNLKDRMRGYICIVTNCNFIFLIYKSASLGNKTGS